MIFEDTNTKLNKYWFRIDYSFYYKHLCAYINTSAVPNMQATLENSGEWLPGLDYVNPSKFIMQPNSASSFLSQRRVMPVNVQTTITHCIHFIC